MFFSVLTTLLFSFSSVMANRSRLAVGAMQANVGRLLLAFAALGAWAFCFGQGVGGAGLGQFLFSGVLGIGVGDLAFFAALPLLGTRLSTMIMQCLAVPVAVVVEWLWLGTTLSAAQLASSAVILAGIVLALAPTRKDPPRVRVRPAGIVIGGIAAVGQGLGAVFSRRGFALVAAAGQPMDGFSAAFQRNLGGLGLTLAWFVVIFYLQRNRVAPEPVPAPRLADYKWVVANALTGPIFGMGTMQIALATTPSGIVLPVMATTPLMVIPFAYWLEGERPSRRSLAGGMIAVAGAVALSVFS
jgi:drug/metabolite transporter (DMT)-like permease